MTAANRDGVWNTDGAALPLRVLPPLYRTWWFIALAIAALAGLLIVTHERRVRGLERARAAQEAFSRQLIESQERERQRIAADLHDSLSQTLAVIKNRALIALRTPEDPGRASEQLDEIAEAATHAIDEVREISYNLRPYHLDRLGLTRAIDAMLDRLSGVDDLQIVREIDPLDDVFPKDAEINVYRIVQEGLANIVKHAGASEARVHIVRSAREVTLTISDNGRGFAPDLSRSSGFGLTGMAGRARWLGGRLDVDSQPGRGTTLRITIGIAEGHGQQDPNPDRR